jgi:hypothetical protein
MPLLCMYILCSLVLIYQVLVLPGVFQTLVGHSCVSPLPLSSGLLPFRRPELGVYCVVCISLIAFSRKHPAPV